MNADRPLCHPEQAKSAISATLDGLRTAYKASADYRAEDRISGLIDALEEGHADLCVIALEIEDDATNDGEPSPICATGIPSTAPPEPRHERDLPRGPMPAQAAGRCGLCRSSTRRSAAPPSRCSTPGLPRRRAISSPTATLIRAIHLLNDAARASLEGLHSDERRSKPVQRPAGRQRRPRPGPLPRDASEDGLRPRLPSALAKLKMVRDFVACPHGQARQPRRPGPWPSRPRPSPRIAT